MQLIQMLKLSSILFTVLDPTYERFSIKLVIRYQFINLTPAWLSKTSTWSCWASNVLKARLSNGQGLRQVLFLEPVYMEVGDPR